jgi:cyclopropane-fatty-acyl-phospholipid synthase
LIIKPVGETMKARNVITELLQSAGIEINGNHPWDVQVHDDRFYQRVLRDTDLGLGESYMDGWWDCEALDEMINRIFLARLDEKVKKSPRLVFHALKSKLFNRQTKSRSRIVGERHYDLGNDLYNAMLDSRMNYTCAYWKEAETLDKAQEDKLDLVCKKIDLKPGMKVLELGCGWGSFAKYAAEKYNAEVVAVNISKEQVKLARKLCKGLPVDIRLADYRDIGGEYDAVVSIGILEHVGYKNYQTYMDVVDRTLKEDGIGFVHTIGSNVSKTASNRWTETYIFPNGMLPSVAQIGRALEKSFVMEDWHNFGPDYDKTLMAWYANFDRAWPQLLEKYDERFYRMWRFYLLSSAGGFRSRQTQLWQVVFTKAGRQQPDCRII